MTTKEMNDMFLEWLSEILDSRPNLFEKDIQSVSDLEDKDNVFWSFQRGSDSRALDQGVLTSDINIVNRWKMEERAGFNKPNFAKLADYYADFRILKQPFVQYTQAM